MKKSLLFVFAAVLALSFVSCKPKQSAYKAAYEKAQEKEVTEEVVEEAPVRRTPPPTTTTPSASNVTTTRERVSAVDGQLKRFSVVVGSFVNKTNADRLKSDMAAKGYKSQLALNERGMYRVIIATFDEKGDAAYKRDEAKSDLGIADAWILEREF